VARKGKDRSARRKPRALVESRTRAAAMAGATRGRSRVFEVKPSKSAGKSRVIAEGREEYEAGR
jgi:hypothetical protein